MRFWLGEVQERPLGVETTLNTEVNSQNALAVFVSAAALAPLALPDLLPAVFDALVLENGFGEPDGVGFAGLVERFRDLRQPFLITVVGPTDPTGIAL